MQQHQTSYARISVDVEQEYRAIEAALLDNPRGRWFLAEHGRRARRLDSLMLEEAIERLQSSIRQPPALLGQLQNEIEELSQFLRDTRTELMAKPPKLSAETPADAPADGILRAAEDLHELAWTLQSNDINAESCEKIARQASAIYALSVRQALESERTQKLALALDAACARLGSLLETINHESQVDGDAAPPAGEGTSMSALLAEEALPSITGLAGDENGPDGKRADLEDLTEPE
ncbi:MAG: hypothetical protein KJZ80_20790 [Hyphomicrobiaceae bacterium]|nr:hypothetical protein [Hyphomicrobiaceae bacterium]